MSRSSCSNPSPGSVEPRIIKSVLSYIELICGKLTVDPVPWTALLTPYTPVKSAKAAAATKDDRII
jgi:hypothetical protein